MSSPSGNTLYNLSIGAYINTLQVLLTFLKKGEAYADEKGIPHSQLLEARLIDDMQPLIYQIQRLSDSAKGVAWRIPGTEPAAMTDDETTFAQLYARIEKTIDVLKAVKPETFEGKETAEVTMKIGPKEHTWTSTEFLKGFATPNFYFHVSMAYALLRKEGVPVGKRDFIGGP